MLTRQLLYPFRDTSSHGCCDELGPTWQLHVQERKAEEASCRVDFVLWCPCEWPQGHLDASVAVEPFTYKQDVPYTLLQLVGLFCFHIQSMSLYVRNTLYDASTSIGVTHMH
jgi:hypothetical protein